MSLNPVAPLYLGCSRSARPLPRGFTGHVAQTQSLHCLRSLSQLSHRYPRGFSGHVASPSRSILPSDFGRIDPLELYHKIS
jgi:hypothetical protein